MCGGEGEVNDDGSSSGCFVCMGWKIEATIVLM